MASVTPGQLGGRAQFWLPITSDYVTLGPFAGCGGDCSPNRSRAKGNPAHLSLQLEHPRQWWACWRALLLWEQLKLDEYWVGKLPVSREGTRWLNVLKTLVCYRLIRPGSEWRLH